VVDQVVIKEELDDTQAREELEGEQETKHDKQSR
jgi:hypothetical protein